MSDLDKATRARVLIVGGYGVFGGRLSRRLARHSDIEIVIAGRSMASAQAHCAEHGGTPALIDTEGDLAAAFRQWQPTVVVDAAGPYQLYGSKPYRVARAALAVDADYLDLADDAEFVAGIAALDGDAKRSGHVVLSGCSSVPAVSAAAVRALADGLVSIESIESTIMPGNRAPRGRSVVGAILAQVGQPIRVRRGGEAASVKGWAAVQRCWPNIVDVEPMRWRYVSPIGAPDLQLFPTHFGARTVRFRAGLELSVMHLGLAFVSWLVCSGILRSASSLTRPLLWMADQLKPFGSDRGAMTVDVIGRTVEGTGVRRRWTLLAGAGDGPEIPAAPAYLLALRLCRDSGGKVPPGARACLNDLTLNDIDESLAPFAISTGVTTEPITTVFEAALAKDYVRLPEPVRDLHDVLDRRAFVGRSSVERGHGALSRFIGWCMAFPPAAADVPVRVDMQRSTTGETWQRRFGRARFRSHLSRRLEAPHGEIWERFGPLSFRINLEQNGNELHYPVDAVRLFGFLPLPRVLVPNSDTREYVNEEGNACFDVSISHPVAGFIVRYRGWLQSIEDDAVDGA